MRAGLLTHSRLLVRVRVCHWERRTAVCGKMLYIVLLRDETVNVAQTHDIWIDIHPFVDLCQGGRDNEPSKMKWGYRDAIDRVQARFHVRRGGRDQSRPYILIPDSFVHDHNHAPTILSFWKGST